MIFLIMIAQKLLPLSYTLKLNKNVNMSFFLLYYLKKFRCSLGYRHAIGV